LSLSLGLLKGVLMKIFYCDHDPFTVRVWREDWAGDQFEIMLTRDLTQFILIALKFGISVELAP
jgi:hypothetical protein